MTYCLRAMGVLRTITAALPPSPEPAWFGASRAESRSEFPGPSVRESVERQPFLAGEPEHVGEVHAAAILDRHGLAIPAGDFDRLRRPAEHPVEHVVRGAERVRVILGVE